MTREALKGWELPTPDWSAATGCEGGGVRIIPPSANIAACPLHATHNANVSSTYLPLDKWVLLRFPLFAPGKAISNTSPAQSNEQEVKCLSQSSPHEVSGRTFAVHVSPEPQRSGCRDRCWQLGSQSRLLHRFYRGYGTSRLPIQAVTRSPPPPLPPPPENSPLHWVLWQTHSPATPKPSKPVPNLNHSFQILAPRRWATGCWARRD